MGSKDIQFTVEKHGKWSAHYSEIYAALSLWMSLFERRREENDPTLKDEESNDYHPSNRKRYTTAGPQPETWEVKYRRILGINNEVLKRDLAWWVGDTLAYQEAGNTSVPVAIGFHGLRKGQS